ncbi:MAG TPA: cupin domain-containing protein [Chitinophagaceae bacterium]|nr:cupin domain-containing protein [Chitinophagaceae bacterium]
MSAAHYITHLQMEPHPEGGYFKQTYCSPHSVTTPAGERPYSTAIYYLLEQGDFSAFHRLKSDECWHFYAGGTLIIHIIEPNGNYYSTRLGNKVQAGEQPQFVVPAGLWFGAEPAEGSAFSLAGCTVAPGFVYQDFEMADKAALLKEYPRHHAIIHHLCR